MQQSKGVTSTSFSPDGAFIATGGRDKSVRLISVATQQEVNLGGHSLHTEAVTSVCFGRDNRLIASGGMDSRVRIWDAESQRQIAELDGLERVRSVALSPDGSLLAAGTTHTVQPVMLWDIETRTQKHVLRGGHVDIVNAVTFSPDRSQLVSVGDDKRICVWNPVTGSLLKVVPGHSLRVTCVSYSMDGHHLASGSDDKTVRVWTANRMVLDDKQVPRVLEHDAQVRAVCFFRDCRDILASATADGKLIIWDVATSSRLRTIEAHTSEIKSIACGPNSMIVSASTDKMVKLWTDTHSGAHRTADERVATDGAPMVSPSPRLEEPITAETDISDAGHFDKLVDLYRLVKVNRSKCRYQKDLMCHAVGQTEQQSEREKLAQCQEELRELENVFRAQYRTHGKRLLKQDALRTPMMENFIPKILHDKCDVALAFKATMRLAEYNVDGWSSGTPWRTSVRKAIDKESFRVVAIKELRDATAMARESSALIDARNQGVAVVEVLHVFQDDATDDTPHFYMVMPWYDGGCLLDWVKRADVDKQWKLIVSHQIATAVSKLHDAGIAHADLKPQNVMIEQTSAGGYVAWLIDLETAIVTKGDASLLPAVTVTRPVTMGYAAPEVLRAIKQANGDKDELKNLLGKIDMFKVDVYGVGGLLRVTETLDPTLDATLNEDPEARPGIHDVVKHLDELIRGVECGVCQLTCDLRTAAAWCRHDVRAHVYCQDCFTNALRHWKGLDPSVHQRTNREVVCSVPNQPGSATLCEKPLVLHVTPGGPVIDAVAFVNHQAGQCAQPIEMPMSSADIIAAEIADLFVLKCPGCKKNIDIDFVACLVLTCTCETTFCGYCRLKGTSPELHNHLQTHESQVDQHCGSSHPESFIEGLNTSVRHSVDCVQRGQTQGEPYWICEPRWRQVWYMTRIRADVENLLSDLPSDEAREEMRRKCDIPTPIES